MQLEIHDIEAQTCYSEIPVKAGLFLHARIFTLAIVKYIVANVFQNRSHNETSGYSRAFWYSPVVNARPS